MAKKRKRKLQNGGRVLTAQEKIAQQILSGQRPAQRQSAARRKGRTTSKLLSDEAYDRASNVLPDPRVFRKAYEKYQAGENLSRQDKIDLGIEGAFAAAALIPGIGFVAQKGKPMVKGIAKDLIGKAADALKGDGKNKFRPSGASASNRTPKPTPKPKNTPPKSKAAPNVIRAGAPKPQAQLPKPKPIRRPDETSGPTIRAGDRLGGATPAVRKPTTPAKPKAAPKPKTSPTDKGKIVGLSPLGKGVVGGALAAGTAAYLSQSEKDAKPAAGSQATKNKAPYVEGYNMDMDDFDSPKPSYPKPPKTSKPAKVAKEADDGYKFYGKEGTGLGDFSRKYNIKYATQEQFDKDFNMDDGEKRGGRPGKSKMKTQGLNRSKRSGFSGRGTGAALRGF